MAIYLMNMFFLILFGFVFLLLRPSPQNKKTFCILATLQWVLLSGLRDKSVGADTLTYKLYFDAAKRYRWDDLWENFVSIMFRNGEGKDPGYLMIERAAHIISDDYQVYLMLIGLFFTIPLGIWIYRNSKGPMISFLLYSTLFYAFFAITGHRQTIATALVVLIGYRFVRDRKFLPFLLLILIALPIHKSSISYLPFFFLAHKKITKPYLACMFGFIASAFVLKGPMIGILGRFTGYEEYARQAQGAGTWTFTGIMVIILGLAVWKHEAMIAENPDVTIYMNALLMAMVFVPLTFVEAATMRVVQYYSLYIVLMIPEIISTFREKERYVLGYAATVMLILLFVSNEQYYVFFWQK